MCVCSCTYLYMYINILFYFDTYMVYVFVCIWINKWTYIAVLLYGAKTVCHKHPMLFYIDFLDVIFINQLGILQRKPSNLLYCMISPSTATGLYFEMPCHLHVSLSALTSHSYLNCKTFEEVYSKDVKSFFRIPSQIR